ncbi:putative zinc-binding protein [Massilia sp. erpn]|uniref:putative zinc-binding protein n=1 Tax=Massilia sp. erpn TaxID=2738142 RepID=UPI002105BF0A|nr:putative zinc-binding protein [Massilia sp. erpn]UTY58997.1 zinc-binding protein [Massilia sp. erpn]
MAVRNRDLPLVYSCSGCSSAAQTANAVAIRLDRLGVAEMSCIAGVGGDVPSLVKLAKSGRPIVAIDGCPLACTRQCLERHGVQATHHILLNEMGIRKRFHADFDADQVAAIADHLAAALPPPSAAASTTISTTIEKKE